MRIVCLIAKWRKSKKKSEIRKFYGLESLFIVESIVLAISTQNAENREIIKKKIVHKKTNGN